MRATVTSVTLIFAICAGCAGAARGRPQSTGTAQGSYSGEQALRGKVLYDRHCASCHGADFEPDEGTPRLTGAAFAWRWKDRSAYDYYERIRTTMPPADTGSLTPQTTVDIVAYLLQVNGFPPGSSELPPNPARLKKLQLRP